MITIVSFNEIYLGSIERCLLDAKIGFVRQKDDLICEASETLVVEALINTVSHEGWKIQKTLDKILSLDYFKNMNGIEISQNGVQTTPILTTAAPVVATKTKGSGRKKGSYSFASVKLSVLMAKLSPDMNVKASRLWLEELGITDAESAKASEVCTKIESVETPEVALQVEQS